MALATKHQSPEEEELTKKEAELWLLQQRLIEQELYIKTLRAETAAFEFRYLCAVDVLYSRVDELNARIAALTARRMEAEEARSRAYNSYEELHTEESEVKKLPPSTELKDLYREAAKRLHPDLAFDDSDREVRSRLMVDANLAYEQCDVDSLRAIIAEHEISPESVTGTDIASKLVRTIRQVASVTRRTVENEQVIEDLLQSGIAKLMANANDAAANGRDMLDEMAKALLLHINALRNLVTLLLLVSDDDEHYLSSAKEMHVKTLADHKLRMYKIMHNESRRPDVTYSYSRFCFLAKHIEPLPPNGIFRMITPDSIFQMTKAQFRDTFANVVASKNYREDGIYHSKNPPRKAEAFRLVSNDG